MLRFKGFNLIFRTYDDGMAYRLVSLADTPFKVKSERAEFNFAGTGRQTCLMSRTFSHIALHGVDFRAGINLKMLSDYAASKNVGLIL